jgi:hypothetical protein
MNYECELQTAEWRRSSRSNAGNECVELSRSRDFCAVRDSKHPDGPVLVFAAEVFAAFLRGA